MIRTLIVDDEPLARRGVAVRLADRSNIAIVGECENGRQAIRAIQDQLPDLLFLDIHMPELDGFAVLSAVKHVPIPAIVFLTAYDEYALAAFDVHAFDYLLKPVDDERFNATLDRVTEMLAMREIASQQRRIGGLLELEAERNQPLPARRFVVRERGRVFFVTADEVDWIEAVGDYAGLHVGSRLHLLRESLASLEAKLNPARFTRIHRSAIVQLDRVVQMQSRTNRDCSVTLKDGRSLNVSRTYSDRLRDAMQRTLV